MVNGIKKAFVNLSNKIPSKKMYYIGICLYAFIIINQYSLIFNISGTYKSIIRIVSFLLMIPKILFQEYKQNEVKVIMLLIMFSLFCVVLGGDKNIIIIPIVFFGIKNIDIKKIVMYIFIINIFSLLLHFIYFVINYYINNHELSSIFYFMWWDINNNLMYTNRNLFAFRYACLFIQYLFITDRNKNRSIKTVVLLLLAVFGYQISNSRTAFIMSLTVILYMFLEKSDFIKSKINIFKNLSLVFGLLSSFFIIYCGGKYEEPFFNEINRLLSGRAHYIYDIYKYIGINTLPSFEKFNNIREYFGRNIVIVPDNSYLSILFKWGLIISLLLLAFVIYFTICKKNDSFTNYCSGIMFLMFVVEYYSPDFIIYIVPLLVMNNYFNREL